LADVIHFKNGDSLTGKVIEKTGKHLKFKTEGGDVASFRWKNISEIRADNLVVKCKGNLVYDGAIVIVEDPEVLADEVGTNLTILARSTVQMINPEPWQLGDGWHKSGRINLSFISERGNAKRDDVDLSVAATWRDKKNRISVSVELENGEADDVETQSKWYCDAKYNRFYNKKMYFSSTASFRHDKFANIELRSTAAGGYGYQFLDSRNTSLFSELLLAYIWENLNETTNEEFMAAIFQFQFEKDLASGFVTLFMDGAGTFGFDDDQSMFIDTSTGVRVPLLWQVMLTAEFKSEYNSNPAGDAEKTDNTARLLVGYKW